MNVLFLAENPQLFIEYAVRLERNDLPFWTASNNNDFHKMMTQVKIDVVLADYHLMNFKDFDVYQHIAKHRKDLVFLFLNDPEGKGDLLVQWEDRVRQSFPDQWTDELNQFLRIMTTPVVPKSFSRQPTRLQDLMEQIDGKGGKQIPELSERMFETNHNRAVEGTGEHEVFPGGAQRDSLGTVAFEDGSLEEFMELRKKYRIGYQEYILMKLFFRRMNQFVEMDEIHGLLKMPRNKKNGNAVYHHIYRIRNFLREIGQHEVQLIRVRKGCYSLVSDERNPEKKSF